VALYPAETQRAPANVCFQCGFEGDHRGDHAADDGCESRIDRIIRHASARHSARMVNGKFPERTSYGFESVDLSESRSPAFRNRISRRSTGESTRQFFPKSRAN
jgi:hypothetical protein